MDLSHTITEPLARLIAFHNAFNLNIKFTYGALARLGATTDVGAERFTLPNGGEPWGNKVSWSDMGAAVQDAAAFVSEMGVVRSTSSFEDYVIGATAELERAAARTGTRAANTHELATEPAVDTDASEDDVPHLRALVKQLALNSEEMEADLVLVQFFQIARNCVVHRSGRASRQLADFAQSEKLVDALKTWPRRKGKWLITVPEIQEGKPVSWLPRHAIMASACHHRCAVAIDNAVVAAMGSDGIVSMAAHWCLLAENSVPSPAKLDAQTMIRTQLAQRYLVRRVNMADLVQSLRGSGIWEKARTAFDERNLKRARDERRVRKR